jgi:inorganic pyrophosphatase
MKLLSILSFSILLFSCCDKSCSSSEKNITDIKTEVKDTIKFDYGKLPFKNENGNITAVIEIPAGTNGKFEYNYELKEFTQEIRDGKPRVVSFLPYVGSYGFIPGTYMDPAIGGDGDALDILIIGESIQQGEIVEIIPIATLKLLDGGEEDHKVIGVPVDNKLNVANITDYASLSEPIKEIIKTWFTSYKGPGEMKFQGWIGTDSTNIEIGKWTKK